jgi:hypothetical protein
MVYRLAAVALAPVLLLQGLRVRLVTPRLPEPPGPRAGSAGQGPALRLLIAGDSAAAGVGVNDVIGGTRSAAFVVRQRQLVAMLKARFGVRHVLLTSLPPMHAFPALPQPLRWYLGARARQFTRLLERVAALDAQCEVVMPRLPLDRVYMASDGFHPGPLAYSEWAREAAAIIRRRVAGTGK